MILKAIFLLTFLAITLKLHAQDNEVSKISQDYIDAFYYGDSVKLERCIAREVVKYGYYRKKDEATYSGHPMSYDEMMKYVRAVAKRGPNKNTSNWPNKVEVLDQLDQTACSKVTAWWGTDYLVLAKINGQWKIQHILWQSPPPEGKN